MTLKCLADLMTNATSQFHETVPTVPDPTNCILCSLAQPSIQLPRFLFDPAISTTPGPLRKKVPSINIKL